MTIAVHDLRKTLYLKGLSDHDYTIHTFDFDNPKISASQNTIDLPDIMSGPSCHEITKLITEGNLIILEDTSVLEDCNFKDPRFSPMEVLKIKISDDNRKKTWLAAAAEVDNGT